MKRVNTAKDKAVVYLIRVQGRLDESWSAWFHELDIHVEDGDLPVTVLSGEIIDQSMLRSILNKLWDLNLTILSVNVYTGTNAYGLK